MLCDAGVVTDMTVSLGTTFITAQAEICSWAFAGMSKMQQEAYTVQ